MTATVATTASAVQENGNAISEKAPHRVFVGNLSYDITTPKLIEFFSKAGKMYALF